MTHTFMGKIILVFFIFLSSMAFAQEDFIGNFDKKESEYYYNQDLYIAHDSIYLLGKDKGSILYLDPVTKKTKLVYQCPQYFSICAITAGPNGIVFAEGRWSSPTTKLFFLRNNAAVRELTFYYSVEGVRALSNHDGSFYYSVFEDNYYHIYQLKLSDLSLTFLYSSQEDYIIHLNDLDQGVLLYEFSESTQKVTAINNGLITPILSRPYNYTYGYSTGCKSNDSTFVYFSTSDTDSTRETWRVNKTTTEFTKFSDWNATNLYFDSDSTFYMGADYFGVNKGTVHADTVSSVQSYKAKAMLSGDYEYVQSFDFPAKYFISSSSEFGVELAKINAEDSVDLIQDLVKGLVSSYPISGCNYETVEFSKIGFAFKGKHYACLSNLNDAFVYLYEVQDDTLISLFKLENFTSRINFFPNDEALIWVVYHDELGLYSVYKRSWNELDAPQAVQKADSSLTWYTEMGIILPESPCIGIAANNHIQDVLIDADNNSYIGFMNNVYGGLYSKDRLYERESDTILPVKGLNFYLKYNPFGKVLWYNSIGDKYKSWANYDKFILNKSGNVTVIGNFYKKGYFDQDSLTSFGSCIFMAHLDQYTGKVSYKKKLIETNFVDDFNISQIEQDSKGNIYLSFHYYDYQIHLFDTVLVSDINRQNALIKLDSLGNFLWAANVLNSWSDYFGDISALKLDEKHNRIFAYTAQDGYYDCETYGWKNDLHCYNLDGQLLSRKQIHGSAMNTNTLFEVLNDTEMFIKGCYNGEIDADEFTNRTLASGDCFAYENFELHYRTDLNRVVKAKTSANSAFFSPISSRTWNDTIYILGSKTKGQLALQRFDLKGNYAGEIALNQYISDPQNHHFDIKNGFITLIGEYYINDSEFGANPYCKQFDAVSILRIESKNWSMGDQSTTAMSIRTLDSEEHFIIHPNPVEESFEVDFNSGVEHFISYQITDMNGKVVQQASCGDVSYLKIDFSKQQSGLYLFTLVSDQGTYSKKLVKL